MQHERKQTDRNVEKSRDTRSESTTNDSGNDKPKRPLDWDARDLEADPWLRDSPSAIKGGYTNRFWE